MMVKPGSLGLVTVLCLAVVSVACGDDDSGPTAPTPTVTLTGTWAGMFTGNLVSGSGQMMLTQEGVTVSGQWSAPMPELLIAQGAPAEIPLAGAVTGMVEGTTATLSLRFAEAFALFIPSDCGLDVSVTSFSETSLEGTYMTSAMCPSPINDQGTLNFTR